MNNKTVTIILVILILIGALFLLNQFLAKKKLESEPVATVSVVEEEKIVVKEPVVKIEKREEVKIVEKPPVKKQLSKEVKPRMVFLGNRGYVIKDGLSTFIKFSILEELKKNNYFGYLPEEKVPLKMK